MEIRNVFNGVSAMFCSKMIFEKTNTYRSSNWLLTVQCLWLRFSPNLRLELSQPGLRARTIVPARLTHMRPKLNHLLQ